MAERYIFYTHYFERFQWVSFILSLYFNTIKGLANCGTFIKKLTWLN